MTDLASRIAAAAILSLALAACGNQSSAPTGDVAAENAVAPSDAAVADSKIAAVALTAKGAPARADGYWRLENIGGGGTTIGTQYLCVGSGSEERRSLFDQIAMNVNCSRYDITGGGADWAFDFVCGAPPMESLATGSVSGDFVKAYKVEQQVTEGDFSQERTIVASNGGACPDGVAPGDLIDDQGAKVTNILD